MIVVYMCLKGEKGFLFGQNTAAAPLIILTVRSVLSDGTRGHPCELYWVEFAILLYINHWEHLGMLAVIKIGNLYSMVLKVVYSQFSNSQRTGSEIEPWFSKYENQFWFLIAVSKTLKNQSNNPTWNFQSFADYFVKTAGSLRLFKKLKSEILCFQVFFKKPESEILWFPIFLKTGTRGYLKIRQPPNNGTSLSCVWLLHLNLKETE
jgi:hypothetical protein